jgi:hypothetical protein
VHVHHGQDALPVADVGVGARDRQGYERRHGELADLDRRACVRHVDDPEARRPGDVGEDPGDRHVRAGAGNDGADDGGEGIGDVDDHEALAPAHVRVGPQDLDIAERVAGCQKTRDADGVPQIEERVDLERAIGIAARGQVRVAALDLDAAWPGGRTGVTDPVHGLCVVNARLGARISRVEDKSSMNEEYRARG